MGVRPKHTWQALCFLYAVDLTASAILLAQWPLYKTMSIADWVSVAIFSMMMAAARVMPAQRTAGVMVDYGWYMTVEFAIIVALPIPLACLSHLPSIPVGMIDRWRKREPEPFRGPDYNAAASIICAYGAAHFFSITTQKMGTSWVTLLLLPTAALFIAIQYVMLQTLVCLNYRKPWYRTDLVHLDSLLGDTMMTLIGALVGRLYTLDRSTILLTILPVVLVQRVLDRIQQSRLIDVDSKTGLHNYRYLDRAFSDEVRRAAQSGRPLTLIFGDMDYLRDINNTYGHLAGDKALKAVAMVFKRHARPEDVAARFGGEEFVLLLPGMEKKQAWGVAESVREEIARLRMETDGGGGFSVTISMGLASFPGDSKSVQGLIKAADEAVYQAKNAGRNRVCAYGSEVAI